MSTIASPCSSAAAITSASRTDPPGCTTAVAPAAATASSPSRNGKKASEAATVPASGALAPTAQPLAFITATFTASTRLIWPAPMARVRPASAKSTVFDLTCAHTRQANRSAVHSSARRLPRAHHLHAVVRPRLVGLGHFVAGLDQQAAEHRPHFPREPRAAGPAEGRGVHDHHPQVGLGGEQRPRLVGRPTARRPPR